MWNHMWTLDGAWGWGWFGLMHLAWWLLLIAGAAFVVRSVLDSRAGRRDGALDILRERFARGEIDQAEYEQRRKFLRP